MEELVQEKKIINMKQNGFIGCQSCKVLTA
jgi:hypothetical protein